MIVQAPATVLDLLQMNPTLTVYRYRRSGTTATLYAVFEVGTREEQGVEVGGEHVELLCAQGQMTAAGRSFLVEHGRRTTG